MATARIRTFAASDFETLVGLYPPEWRFAGSTSAIDEAQGRADLAFLISCCNLRLVAEVTPKETDAPQVAGLLFARTDAVPPLPAEDVQRWETVADAAFAELEGMGGTCVGRIIAYVNQLEARAKMLEDAAGETRGADNELELFVVGPAARGHGAGSALITAFEDTLRTAGQVSYWLQTDTRCTWQWYERHGYVRVADVPLPPGYSMPDGPACHPSDAAEPPRAFMYRKDLA